VWRGQGTGCTTDIQPSPAPPTWGSYASKQELVNSGWAGYFQKVYEDELPGGGDGKYPVDVREYWCLFEDLLTQYHPKSLPDVVGRCPPRGSSAPVRYQMNNPYSPLTTTWIWHPPPANAPYPALTGEDGWVEVGVTSSCACVTCIYSYICKFAHICHVCVCHLLLLSVKMH
jgi:hypothetical protein